MKYIYILLFWAVTFQFGSAQGIDFELISLQGLNFYSSKSEIIRKLGAPQKIFEPNKECGFLSNTVQGVKYVTLDFGQIKFTGNKKQGYLIELIDFEQDCSIVLHYGDHRLTCATELADLIRIFGKEYENYFGKKSDGVISLRFKNQDDEVHLVMKSGKLIRFEYWSPC